jgi:TRAP transporter 4TM/12TM fusion protein
MVTGYSPFKAAFYSIVMLIVLYVIWNRNINKEFWVKIGSSIVKGVKSAMPIAAACAAAGIISGVLSVTGLGSKLSSMIITFSHGYILVALILTMLTSIILGMGLPTTAAYLILASVVAPALAKMGVPLLTAHLFVFFYGCISTITPPVALASYIAAGIADADINKVGWTAFRYGLSSYVLPFMFFYSSALLLQGSAGSIIINVILSFIGIASIAVSVVGFYKHSLNMPERIIAFAAGVLMIYKGIIPSAVGLLIFAGIIILNIKKSRLPKKAI